MRNCLAKSKCFICRQKNQTCFQCGRHLQLCSCNSSWTAGAGMHNFSAFSTHLSNCTSALA